MLPFHHAPGFTLFPKAQKAGGRWVGVIDIRECDGRLRHRPSEDEFETEHAAVVSASIDRAAIANSIRSST
jgi:hypothetical protein